MADLPEINIKVTLAGIDKVKKGLADLQKGVKNVGKEAKEEEKFIAEFDQALAKAIVENEHRMQNFNRTLRQFGTGLSAVGGQFRNLGLTITGTFTASLISAAKELPQVDRALKGIKEIFSEFSKTLAVATLPILNEFTPAFKDFMNQIRVFIQQHPCLVRSVAIIGALALVLGQVAVTIGRLTTALAKSQIIGFLLAKPGTALQIVGVTSAILALAIAFDKFASAIEKVTNIGSKVPPWLLQFFKSGPVGLGAGAGQQAASTVGQALGGAGQDLPEIEDRFGRFARGLQSTFKELAENIEEFGRAIGQALDDAFGDTIFQAITGRLKGLRSILLSFRDDVARAFARGVSNTILGGIFGTPSSKGLVSGLPFGGLMGKLFGGFGGGPGGGGGKGEAEAEATEATRLHTQEIKSATTNLQLFQQTKDRVIQNMNVMSSTLQTTSATHSQVMDNSVFRLLEKLEI